jgi:hypothetical protein
MKDVISGPQVMQIEYCHAKIKTMQFCRQAGLVSVSIYKYIVTTALIAFRLGLEAVGDPLQSSLSLSLSLSH